MKRSIGKVFFLFGIVTTFANCPSPFPDGPELDALILSRLVEGAKTSTSTDTSTSTSTDTSTSTSTDTSTSISTDTSTSTSTDTSTSTSTDTGTATASVPLNAAQAVNFADDYDRRDSLGGNVAITKATDESDIDNYVLYWGDSATTKQNATPITSLAKTGSDLNYTIPDGTSLAAGVTHILVYTENAEGEMSSGVSIAFSDLIELYIFVTGDLEGNLDGVNTGSAGATTICNNNKGSAGLADSSGTFVAMMMDSSQNSTTAFFEANRIYQQAGAPLTAEDTGASSFYIGTTNGSAVLTFPLSNPFDTSTDYIWTGMDSSWSNVTGEDCNEWNDNSFGANGYYGILGETSSRAIDDTATNIAIKACDSLGVTHKIVCVEQ